MKTIIASAAILAVLFSGPAHGGKAFKQASKTSSKQASKTASMLSLHPSMKNDLSTLSSLHHEKVVRHILSRETDESKIAKLQNVERAAKDSREKLQSTTPSAPIVTEFVEVSNPVFDDIDSVNNLITRPDTSLLWYSERSCALHDSMVSSIRAYTRPDSDSDFVANNGVQKIYTGPWNACFPKESVSGTACGGSSCEYMGKRIVANRNEYGKDWDVDEIQFLENTCKSTDTTYGAATTNTWETDDDTTDFIIGGIGLQRTCDSNDDLMYDPKDGKSNDFFTTPQNLDMGDTSFKYLHLQVFLSTDCDESTLVMDQKIQTNTCFGVYGFGWDGSGLSTLLTYDFTVLGVLYDGDYRNVMINDDGTFNMFHRDQYDDDSYSSFCEDIQPDTTNDDDLGKVPHLELMGPNSRLDTCEMSGYSLSFKTTIVTVNGNDSLLADMSAGEKLGLAAVVLFSFLGFAYLLLQIVMYFRPVSAGPKYAATPQVELTEGPV
jgi:hypothetical protein